MVFIALLRGINVGGNNLMAMPKLKNTFEQMGLSQVRTYINSGNIIFESDRQDLIQLVQDIEAGIAQDFGFPIRVLLRDFENIKKIYEKLPMTWVHNPQMKSNVLFLWDEVNRKSILDELPITSVDEVIFVNGTILWHTATADFSKSGLEKLAGTKIYKLMTVRNANTFRKIYQLMGS